MIIVSPPQAQEYLGSKMAMLRSFIGSTFYCSEDQEGSYAHFSILSIT